METICVWINMDGYEFVWICMGLVWTFVWILVVPFLGFS